MHKYQLNIEATGEVRDADGNLLEAGVTATGQKEIMLTDEQVAQAKAAGLIQDKEDDR